MTPSVGRITTGLRRARRTALAVALVVLVPVFALVARAATLPLPEALREGLDSESIRFVDRDGHLLREVRADDATRARSVALSLVGEDVVHAILAAEDRRFYDHRGVDAVAVARAALSDAAHARIVSGASTLTMQLARLVRPHPKTFAGKFDEGALALRIEASLSKSRILEEYLNRAPFGAGVRGIDAAARFWFDKGPAELSLAEAATLAAIPRGPAVYALDRHPERATRRRDRILDRMVSAGWATRADAERAKLEPLVTRTAKGHLGAPHLVQALVGGDAPLWPAELGQGPGAVGADRVQTTIAADLQREAEQAVRGVLGALAARNVGAAAVLVIDNATGELLAYVGSPDFAEARQGQNDGVRAQRQPGSTLKPFVYGAAMERLGWSPATALPDVALQLSVPEGVYEPMNYDERFHGPVRLREALGSSLNVPAVWTATQVGSGVVLARLREVGFALPRAEDWYGPAIALGDGEVTLLELTNAYAAIARGGVWRPVRAVRSVTVHGQDSEPAPATSRRVLREDVAQQLADVLADPRARIAAFGEQSALDLPFDVAAKTGTSKGSRDNWTVGFTRDVTVGVWAGNFDGSPMRGTSGITGAAPIFHAVMEAAMRGRHPASLRLAERPDRAADLESVEVCSLSGARPGAGCRHSVEEWMTRDAREALPACSMHEIVRIDRRNGLRAGPGCGRSFIEERTFERFEPAFAAWAEAAGRSRAPVSYSPMCPGPRVDPSGLRIGWPDDGARFVIDPDRPAALQRLPVRVEAPSDADRVELIVDGRAVATVAAPFVADWTLTPGNHVLVARAGSARSAPVTVAVQ